MKGIALTSLLAISIAVPAFGTDTITINWDANNGTNTTTNSCIYGDTITLPPEPSKAGYTFLGWDIKAQPAQCSLSGLDASTNDSGDDNGYLSNDGSSIHHPSTYGLTENGTWAVEFNYGVIKGEALCSSTVGSWATTGSPATTGGGENCWCRATTYTANNADMCVVLDPVWVCAETRPGTCSSYCAGLCVYRVGNQHSFRTALFGQSN